jgi:5-methylcytosine-specific restriction endonuclease McrA
MLPIILDIPMIIDKETFDQSKLEIDTIENQTKALDTYWKYDVNEAGDFMLPSTAVFWLFFWADTKGKDIARQVFRNIFNVRYEEFYHELNLIKPGFKTDGSKNNNVRNNLKSSKKTSDDTLKIIIEKIYAKTIPEDKIKENDKRILEEQDAIAFKLSNLSDAEINDLIKKMQDKERKIKKNSSSKKQRNQYLMELYKKKRNYECQFCHKKILKANGNYYIEACHIKAVEDEGNDNENNILILCPNCHKEFDYGRRSEPEWKENKLSIIINEKKYEIEF